ncbi:MAG: response regulator [Desulfuromonadaceae bacterium]|nr:response regulator [Desulfuromonadaceae bacterium]
MNFYANLKIRDKLILGFFTIVVMSLAVGIFSFFQIYKLERSGAFLFNRGITPVKYIGNIAADFQRLRSNIRELILVDDQKLNEYYYDRVIKFRTEIDDIVSKLETALPDAEAKKLFDRMVQSRSDYTPHIKWIVDLSRFNKDDEATAYLRSDVVRNTERAEMEAIENLQNYLVANAEIISSRNSSQAELTGFIMLCLAGGVSLLAVIMTTLITRSIITPLNKVLTAVRILKDGGVEKSRLVEAVAGGDLSQEMVVGLPLILDEDQFSSDEMGMLLKAIVEMSEVQYFQDQAFVAMTHALRQNRDQEEVRSWFKDGRYQLSTILQGDKSAPEFSEQALAFLVTYLRAGVGVFYLYEESEGALFCAATYACTGKADPVVRLCLGEGIAGQAALEQKMICLDTVPPDYLRISSGLGESKPAHSVALPLVHNGILTGLLEIASFTPFSEDDQEFLHRIMEPLAAALSITKSRQRVNELLEQSQSQAEEMRVQQEELQQTNEELEERAQLLEQQREEIRAKNRVALETGIELQRKADELQRVSTYKSEFLANMSHELRTPLNSLMILSSLLKDNREGNLTAKQVEFAATINGAGRDLLHLINDILDLSKIESGHMEFHYEELVIPEICLQLQTVFIPIACDKGIKLTVSLDELTSETITTDVQRTQQILKNLLSNACKFTSQGSVTLHAYTPKSSENPLQTEAIAFAVTDTGIGIHADKQLLIFNAFQQADGSTSRTYGGTGLGLSISRQLARSMGGEIFLISEVGKGSTFTVYLPIKGLCDFNPEIGKPAVPVEPTRPDSQIHSSVAAANNSSPEPLPAPIPDDREQMREDGKSILIIEDDLAFAGILLKMVRDRGFSALVATNGESGIAVAERYRPSAIILDVMLLHIDGWGVMRSLKDNPVTRHIPVHFITCLDERQKAMSMGAVGFVTKPVSSEQMDTVFDTLEVAIDKSMKKLLIVEDDQAQSAALVALLEEKDVTITIADSGAKAIIFLSGEQFDCIVLDLGLADMGAFELLEELKKLDPERRIPVIIHTGRELTYEDEKRLHRYAESIIIKGAKSPERLLNEVTLFLHLVESSLNPNKQRMIRSAIDKEAQLAGKKILIVDDDMRNIFSLSSALAEKNIDIFEAENGREALNRLNEFPDIDLVLMDIMMPEMDGYEAMRAIRNDPRFHAVPIIALTAKAMKGDREECLKAGASDYIPKPVDMEKLFSLLRVWLYSQPQPIQPD